MKQNFSRPTWNHSWILWSWPWNYWKVQVDTSPFNFFGLLNEGMLNRSEVLCITVAVNQSNGQNWLKRQKTTVPNCMRLLNSGTLNRGRNLWVTVAIDHLTVDGFHDELQPSAKKHQRRFDESVESMNFIWFVGMNITPFLFFSTYWNSTNSGAQYYPKHSSNTSGTRVRESWKGILLVADLEQLDMMDASEFYYVKLNSKDMISPKLVTIPQNRRWTIKIYWRSSFWELKLWLGTIQVRGEVQEDFLVESDGFPPTTIAGSQCTKNTAYTEIIDIVTKIASKNIWEKLSWTSSTSRLTPSITDKLLTWYRVYRQRLHSQACLHLHLRHHQRKILKVQDPSIKRMW